MVATAAYLPLYVHTVRVGLQGARPSVLTILILAIVVIGAIPVIGSGWLQAWGAVGGSVLIGLRPGWAIPVFLVLLGAVVIGSVQLATPGGRSTTGLRSGTWGRSWPGA